MIDKNSFQKQLLIYILGILDGIKKNVIDTDESFLVLFKPNVILWLKENNFDNDLINLIDEARELEDIKELIPNSFNDVVDKLYCETLSQLKESSKITNTIPTSLWIIPSQ